MDIRTHLQALWHELPQAILLAVLTAVTTLFLVIVVSVVLGGETNEHRQASRCFAHDNMALLREIVLADPDLRKHIDLSRYPIINVDGVDCSALYESLEVPQ